MPKRFGTQSDDAPQGNGSAALAAIDALYDLEMKSNLLALRQQRRTERLHRSLAQWSEYWPMAVGILISLVAPQIKEVAGTNYCRVYATVDERAGRIIVIAALDNLMKGAAGQAVQNMNVMLALPEREGLL